MRKKPAARQAAASKSAQAIKPTEVLIVEDHPIVRYGLRSFLHGRDHIRVTAEVGTVQDARKFLATRAADVVLMDIGLPDGSGIDLTREIKADWPKTRVIALSIHANARTVREIMQVGAAGFVSKESICENLIDAIHAGLKGERYLSPDVVKSLCDDYLSSSVAGVRGADAGVPTGRQREIFELLCDGRRAKEIAERLHISQSSVSKHRARLMKRVGAKSIAELVKLGATRWLYSV